MSGSLSTARACISVLDGRKCTPREECREGGRHDEKVTSKGDVRLRLIVSRIITSVSQFPTPGPPRRERVGNTRFWRVFIPSFAAGACAVDFGLLGWNGAGDDEDAVGCWRLPARGRPALALPLRALDMSTTATRRVRRWGGGCRARRRRRLDSRSRGGTIGAQTHPNPVCVEAIGLNDSTPTKRRARQTMPR